MRSTLVIVLASLLCACSVLDQMVFNGPTLDPSKVYLSPATPVSSVSRRDTYRYACVDAPLLCVQRGVDFDCRCP